METLKLPESFPYLEPLREIFWPEILEKWKEDEAPQELWQNIWKQKGYSSWEEWRGDYISPLQPQNLKWSLFKLKDPLKNMPSFFGVPTKTWIQNFYKGATTMQLKDIQEMTETSSRKINDLKKNFPAQTMLVGIIHQGKIILIEGMHRACALAGWNPSQDFNSEVCLALANWDKEEIPILN